MIFGLLGEHLGHSYSPMIHSIYGNYSYQLFEVSPGDLGSFLRSDNFNGLNVTIPYKKAVIPYCSELSPTAQALGAVNTIIRKPDGSLIGHNTDYFGFSSMLDRTKCTVTNKKVLVLGSGGASATVTAVLNERKAHPVVISRNGPDNYSNISRHADAAMIVNTTPVGMYPNVGVSPMDLEKFQKLEAVLDVVYNPARTKLLMDAQSRGLVTENGLWMLVAQAKESAEWFTGTAIADTQILYAHKRIQKKAENTILIGMPGCGKTTIGKRLASALSKKFVDADEKISELTGKTISEIFLQDGEATFRQLESQVLADLGKQSGLVISTGGGCVTCDSNYPSLHQNGCIYWLQRDIHLLPTAGRPLSATGNLEQMYQQRKPLYEKFADYTVLNNAAPEDAVQRIIELEELL